MMVWWIIAGLIYYVAMGVCCWLLFAAGDMDARGAKVGGALWPVVLILTVGIVSADLGWQLLCWLWARVARKTQAGDSDSRPVQGR